MRFEVRIRSSGWGSQSYHEQRDAYPTFRASARVLMTYGIPYRAASSTLKLANFFAPTHPDLNLRLLSPCPWSLHPEPESPNSYPSALKLESMQGTTALTLAMYSCASPDLALRPLGTLSTPTTPFKDSHRPCSLLTCCEQGPDEWIAIAAHKDSQVI